MQQFLYRLWREEDGQDLIEYSLLITFIAIACAAIIGSGRPAVNGIWLATNNQIQQANSTASGS
jgi:Flp pilus assembly pilin Flp